jgi:AcrR family transcriptional regulator
MTTEPHQSRKPAGAAVLQPGKTDAIVAAFYEELAETGHEGLTMDRVAARAGVGKAALYRRWRSKDQMLAELIEALGGDGQTPPPDLGSLRADLIAYLDSGADVADDPVFRRAIPYVISQAHSSPELVRGFGNLPGPSREAGRVVLRRAIDRRELPADTDVELALDLITGPVIMRVMIMGESLDGDYSRRLIDAVLRTLQPGPTPGA